MLSKMKEAVRSSSTQDPVPKTFSSGRRSSTLLAANCHWIDHRVGTLQGLSVKSLSQVSASSLEVDGRSLKCFQNLCYWRIQQFWSSGLASPSTLCVELAGQEEKANRMRLKGSERPACPCLVSVESVITFPSPSTARDSINLDGWMLTSMDRISIYLGITAIAFQVLCKI